MEPLSPHDPRTIGEFELRARLGSGGMGRVYLGRSRAGRVVAVKVVRPELADDPQFKRRFAREVEAAKAVGGMYTAPVVAAGLDDNPPWLATAFVPGPSLDDLVDKHGPLSEQATWRLAAGLAEALQAVHNRGLVHRDLKPGNVLLAADGPHLIDFGISRALDGSSLTATGVVVGTPAYMSPEQAEGQPCGQPSDIFSLGALLAFAATGKAPFGGGSMAAVAYRLVSAQPELTGVPSPRLRDFLTACMAKDPAKRPDLKSMSATIANASGTGSPGGSSLTAFWPADVAKAIQAARPDLDRLDIDPTIPAYPAKGGTRRMGPDTAKALDRAPVAVLPAPSSTAKPAGPGRQHPAPYRPGRYPPVPDPPPPYRAGRYPPVPYRPSPYPPGAYAVPRRGAAALMRLGAALSAVNMIVGLADIGALKMSAIARHPMISGQAVRGVANLAAGVVITTDLFGIAAWLWLAAASSRGRTWPRATGTTLFCLYTVAKLATIGGPGFYAGKVLDVAIWVVGLLAVIALWRRPHPPR